MPVYLVIYSSVYNNVFQLNIKTIYRVIPTTTDRKHLEAALAKCNDLLHSAIYPCYQWEVVLKPENDYLEAMAELMCE